LINIFEQSRHHAKQNKTYISYKINIILPSVRGQDFRWWQQVQKHALG